MDGQMANVIYAGIIHAMAASIKWFIRDEFAETQESGLAVNNREGVIAKAWLV